MDRLFDHRRGPCGVDAVVHAQAGHVTRVVGMVMAGLAPRIMGMGPAPAARKVLELTGFTLAQMDVIEQNEAFAAHGLVF